jgi:hypothetical protein
LSFDAWCTSKMSNTKLDALPVGSDDEAKRAFAWDLIKASNEVVVEFAKMMSTTSLTAIGVLLSLAKFAGLGKSGNGWQLLFVGFSCIVYLAAALLFSYAVRGRQIAISPDDYDDVVEQFLSIARLRQRMTGIGLGLVALATSCGLTVILVALGNRT